MVSNKFRTAVVKIISILNSKGIHATEKEELLNKYMESENTAYEFLRSEGFSYSTAKNEWSKTR